MVGEGVGDAETEGVALAVGDGEGVAPDELDEGIACEFEEDAEAP